jgi:hypothetical protein
VLIGNGDGIFQNQTIYPIGDHPEYVTTGDFNHDTKVDLAVSDLLNGSVGSFFGQWRWDVSESNDIFD